MQKRRRRRIFLARPLDELVRRLTAGATERPKVIEQAWQKKWQSAGPGIETGPRSPSSRR